MHFLEYTYQVGLIHLETLVRLFDDLAPQAALAVTLHR